jgi:triacylglycerol lipase
MIDSSAMKLTPDSPDLVVLIHGLGRSKYSMSMLKFGIQRAGYRVLSVGYPSRDISISEAAANHLGPILAKLEIKPGSRVHFVTHSLGGIVFRAWAAARDPSFPLGRTVLLVPPNQGSEIIDMLQPLRWPRWILGPVVDELGTAQGSTPKTLGTLPPETGVLMGNQATLPLFSHLLGPEHDGLVTTSGGRVEGLTDFIVLPVNHFTVLFKPCVLRAVRHYLQHGSFT